MLTGMRIALMPRRRSGTGGLGGAMVSFPGPGEPPCVEGPGFQGGECQEMVLISRKDPAGLIESVGRKRCGGEEEKAPGNL